MGFVAQTQAQLAKPELARAEALVRSGKAAEAYAMLEPYEFDHSGNPDFDYWFGVAALESAHPDKASLALERALSVNPDFVAARLDLARRLAALPEGQRAALVLRFYLDLSERETAEALGIAPGTVKSRVARALGTLADAPAGRPEREETPWTS